MSAAATTPDAVGARAPRAALIDVYRAEQRKLVAQLSTRVLALVCALGPFAFGGVLSLQSGVPADTLLGVWVHSSGYAVSFVVLGFGGYLGFPVLAGVLAGDMFSCEDRYGTWKSVLTRSRSRGELFAGKCLALLALASALLVVTAVSSLLSGLLFTGDQPIVGLGGSVLSSGEALWLSTASSLLSLPPLLAFASIAVLLSVASRNGIVGVLGPVIVGVVMQLLALVGSGSWMHVLLVASAFADWHGLLGDPKYYTPTLIGTAISLLWIVACLGGAWLILRRRDFAGPPLSRRAGWVMPARAVGACAVAIVVLGLAGGLGPVAITKARLEASMSSTFQKLTLLQQRELGRALPSSARLNLHTRCYRHAGSSEGPGDDWSCTITVLRAQPGAEPFRSTPVTYDMSVKSEGCYKGQAPPSFVGQQTMTDVRHDSVVNPLYSIYGCFDTTGAAPSLESTQSPPAAAKPPSPAQRRREKQALHEAESKAGPKVMRE
ncbi:MAG TPA: ABC transporter permease, partial [Solirubrobacteraceae bacterium]|nr:ABC transporter permease [Solirubrobacteraceae bacterium]